MSEMQDRVKLVLRTFRSATTEIQAREVLKAMREPTDNMMVAAEEAAPCLSSFAVKEKSPSYIAYTAMIDDALT